MCIWSLFGSGRFTGEGNGSPLQLLQISQEEPGGLTVHEITKSQMQLTMHTYTSKPFTKSTSKCTLSRIRLCSPLGSSVHGILQARVLEWVAMPSSRGSSRPMDRTRICSPCLLRLLHFRRLINHWATGKAPLLPVSALQTYSSQVSQRWFWEEREGKRGQAPTLQWFLLPLFPHLGPK